MEGIETKIRIEKISDPENTIIGLLAESVANEITEHGTDNILEGFKKHLHFAIKKQVSDWKSIEEIFLRRNILIHNKGIPSKKYQKKIGHSGESRLRTDTKYVKESLETFEKTQKTIQDFLFSRYGNPKFLEQMGSEDILE